MAAVPGLPSLSFMAAMQTKKLHTFQTPKAFRFWQDTLLVETMCDWLPHMKVRHPVYTRLRLRITCRRILQAMHAPLISAANFLSNQLCEQMKRHAQSFAMLKNSESYDVLARDGAVIEWWKHQHKALKRIHDSGVLYHMWLPFSNGSRGVLYRDGDLLTLSPETGLPHGMTRDYWNARMPPIKKFGWYNGKFNIELAWHIQDTGAPWVLQLHQS